MSGNVGKEEVSGGESGPGWFVHILLACQCLILGMLAWLVFVLDEGLKNSPRFQKGPQLRCHPSFSSGDLGLGWE